MSGVALKLHLFPLNADLLLKKGDYDEDFLFFTVSDTFFLQWP